jgi:hypothetical protein
MAKRFHSENIYSVNDAALFVVEIHDSSFSGSSTEFKVTAPGFQLRPDGVGRELFMPVVSTEFSMEMYIQNSTHAAFIEDLSSSQEGRFKVRITKDGNLHHVSTIIADIGHYEDRDYPYTFTIKGTDLGNLINKTYSLDDYSPYTGTDTFIGHIFKAIGFTGLLDFGWAGSDICLTTVANWYEDSHVVANDKDPLALTRFDHRALFEVESTNKYKFTTAMEVLRQLMQRMGCQFRQSAGQFRVMQVTELVNANPRARHYDKAGSYLSNSAPAYTYDISGQDTDGARLAGGQYTWMPIIREVTETYRHRNWVNLLAGASFDGSTGFVGPTIEAGASQVNMVMDLSITREMTNNSNAYYSGFFEIYRMTLRVGDRYLSRPILSIGNHAVQYQTPATWTTDVKYFYFHIQQPGTAPTIGNSEWFTSSVSFTLPKVVASGAMTMNLNFDKFSKSVNGDAADLSMHSISATGTMLAVENASQGLTETVYTAQNATASATSIKVPLTSLFADGTQENTMGRLQVYDGSTWTNSTNWKVGGTGTGYSIQNLLIRSLVALQKAPVPKMEHTVGYAHGYEPHMRLDDGNDIWAFLGGTFTARYNDWQGEWYRVTYSPTDISTVPSYEVPIGTGPVRTPATGGTISQGPSLPGGSTPTAPTFPDSPVPDSSGTGFLVGNFSGVSTSTSISQGAVTSIPLNQSLNANGYTVGQQITVIHPVHGISATFTVTDDVADGDTSISVTGYAPIEIGAGAFVVTPQSNGIVAGTGTTDNAASSPWWSIFAQHWVIDNTNEFPYPIESPDVVFETSENAGDGSTAGLRFDGDGLQSWTASSATAGVKVGTDGKLYLANLDTATGTVGLVLEGGYVKQKTISIITDHGALSGLGDDDHSIYALLAGRASGQTINGGTNSGANITLQSTTHATKGLIIISDPLFLNSVATGTSNQVLIMDSGVVKQKTLTVVTDHGGLTGLGDDDHTQYALLAGRSGGQALYGGTDAGNSLALQSTTNASRGVITLVDQVQLSNVPTGTGTAGLLIEGGVIKQKTLPTVITDHGALTGLGDDDHTQYALLAGRSGGQSLIGGTASGNDLNLQSTSHATRGQVVVKDTLQLDTVASGTGSTVLLLDAGIVKSKTINTKDFVYLLAVTPLTTVTQSANTAFYQATWLVPNDLNGKSISRVDYALTGNNSSSGSLLIGFNHYNTSNNSVANNIFQVTFAGGSLRESVTADQSLTAGHWFHATVGTIAGTLNGTVTGLLITIEITK